jgi:hypothetical protein
MHHDTPIHTFWSIIAMTLAALFLTRWLGIPGEKAMPVFILFMFLGVPIGELVERFANRPKRP